LLLDDFANHFRPTNDLFVLRQIERRNVTRTMAFHTSLLQNAGYLIRVSDLAVRLWLLNATDMATDRCLHRLRYIVAGEQFSEGDVKVTPPWLIAHVPDTILVVNSSPISYLSVSIQYKHFGRPHGCKLVGDLIANVF
jgi:hypothetical protein